MTHFHQWYISLKIPQIAFDLIPTSLKFFWIEYFEKLDKNEQKLIIESYEKAMV